MNTLDEAGKMGQVCWIKKETSWVVRHIQDQDAEGLLRSVANLDELEELVRWDEQGKYRPLRSEGNLGSGWSYCAQSLGEFREAMEVIYPGMWGNAEAWGDGGLKFPTWEEALAKQTERVRGKVAKAGDLPQRVVAENCQKRCLKAVLWAGVQPIIEPGSAPLLCTGPCGMFWSCVEG